MKKFVAVLLPVLLYSLRLLASSEQHMVLSKDSGCDREIVVKNFSQFPVVLTTGKTPPSVLGSFLDYTSGQKSTRLGFPGEIDGKGRLRADTAVISSDLEYVRLRAKIAFRTESQAVPSFFDYSINETYIWHFIAYGAEVFITPLLGKFALNAMPGPSASIDKNFDLLNSKIENLIKALEEYEAIDTETKDVDEKKKLAKLNTVRTVLSGIIDYLPVPGLSSALKAVVKHGTSQFLQALSNMLKAGLKARNIPVALSMMITTVHLYYLAEKAGAVTWLEDFAGLNKHFARITVISGAVILNAAVLAACPKIVAAAMVHPFAAVIAGKVLAGSAAYYYYKKYQARYGDYSYHDINMGLGIDDHLTIIIDQPTDRGLTIRMVDRDFGSLPVHPSFQDLEYATEISDDIHPETASQN